MSFGLSLQTVYEMARGTVLTLGESLAGELSRDRCDQRIDEVAQRILQRARVRLSVLGTDRLPAEGTFVYMSNHQSHLDIPVLYAALMRH